ncbi:MAG: LysR family transcriptional regulator [Pigmentiphaga sp.]|nr:LysR family transcriptional regulator [Pigmentiphaga sp.]
MITGLSAGIEGAFFHTGNVPGEQHDIMANDRIRELDIFMRVAGERSFSAAARALDCDPSTVSKLIQRMETRLGVRLFHRTSRMLHLTQEGESYLEGAQRVLEALEEAEEGVARRLAEVEGVLRVNSTLLIAQSRLLPVMPELTRRHPKLQIELILTAAPLDLFEHQIDLSLRSGHVPDSSLVARRIAGTRWLTCAAPAYLERHGEPRHANELSDHNCLNFLPGSYRSNWLLKVDGKVIDVPVQGSIRANSAEALRTMVLQGLGIARLPEPTVRDELRNGSLVAVLPQCQVGTEEPVYAVYPSKRHLSPRVGAVLEVLTATKDPLSALPGTPA